MGPLLHDSSPHKHFFSGKTWNAAPCRTVFVVMNGKMLVYFGVHSSKIPYMFLFFWASRHQHIWPLLHDSSPHKQFFSGKT